MYNNQLAAKPSSEPMLIVISTINKTINEISNANIIFRQNAYEMTSLSCPTSCSSNVLRTIPTKIYSDVIMSAIASQITGVLFHRLLRRRSTKTSKLHVTGLCDGNPPVTGEFPSQRASNAEDVSIWWRHHEVIFNHNLAKFSSFVTPISRWYCSDILPYFVLNFKAIWQLKNDLLANWNFARFEFNSERYPIYCDNPWAKLCLSISCLSLPQIQDDWSTT